MAKVTKATIKKAIKELGFNVDDFQIQTSGSAPRIETALTNIKKGNAQVRKVVKHLTQQGANAYGIQTGYGSWVYKFEAMSHSTQLALANID
jgi:histidine ammonia-lyase